MTQEIIEMAREAGFVITYIGDPIGTNYAMLEAFAKLVEDKVTARYMQLFLDPENQPTQFGTATQEYREQEIKDEREACAEEAECIEAWYNDSRGIAKAIRARGEA
jgi:hypothetical protein